MYGAKQLEGLKAYGFHFKGAKGLMPKKGDKMGMDAALTTVPNTNVPGFLTTMVDPAVIEILTAPRNMREIFTEVQKGDWTTSSTMFRQEELTGSTEPYTDYGQSGMSGVNVNWVERGNYPYQTLIQVGDREAAVSGRAALDLAAAKQRSAANTIDYDGNRFAVYGVDGQNIYGLLNEPNMPAAIAPATGAGGLLWSQKTPQEIYLDVLELFKELTVNSAGYITQSTPLKLIMSPSMHVNLGRAAEQFDTNAMKLVSAYFSSLTVHVLPELEGIAGGNLLYMVATELNGQKTAEVGVSDKLRTFEPVRALSSYSQKFAAGTYGFILYQPLAVAVMRGI